MSNNMRVETDKDFGTRECPGCGLDVEANHNRCPVCGYEFPNVPEPRGAVRWIVWILLALGIAATLLMLTVGL